MPSPANPFAKSSLAPGCGRIVLARLGTTQILQDVGYQYPLKLIAPAPLPVSARTATRSDESPAPLVHTVFLLTYGGGLVGGDAVDLHVALAGGTRLSLLTQGSTKIFKAPATSGVASRQRTRVDLAPAATLVYLPDPVQPFAASVFETAQVYTFTTVTGGDVGGGPRVGWANLCVLDWVSAGRPARGESWALHRYVSRNEVYLCSTGSGTTDGGPAAAESKPRLLLRDTVILKDSPHARVAERTHNAGALGTLIVCGAGFAALADFFVHEFSVLPRIGAKDFDPPDQTVQLSDREAWRARRLLAEERDGILWTAARTRGFVVVKFSASSVEGGKTWLRDMLEEQGSVVDAVGDRGLLCLR